MAPQERWYYEGAGAGVARKLRIASFDSKDQGTSDPPVIYSYFARTIVMDSGMDDLRVRRRATWNIIPASD